MNRSTAAAACLLLLAGHTSSVRAMQCIDDVLTHEQLAAIVARARAERSDVPAPAVGHLVFVDRVRCLYLYLEHPPPGTAGEAHLFRIDQYGEMLDFSRHKTQPADGDAPESSG